MNFSSQGLPVSPSSRVRDRAQELSRGYLEATKNVASEAENQLNAYAQAADEGIGRLAQIAEDNKRERANKAANKRNGFLGGLSSVLDIAGTIAPLVPGVGSATAPALKGLSAAASRFS
jgi:hypothetical protein